MNKNNIIVDIYLITNNINGKLYVGITKNGYLNRFKGHIKVAITKLDKKDGKKGKHLYNAMRKHGIENFEIKLIEKIFGWKNGCEREKYWIKELNTFGTNSNGYNETKGGEGTIGVSTFGKKNGMYGKGYLISGDNHYTKSMTKEEYIKWRTGINEKISGENNFLKRISEKEVNEYKEKMRQAVSGDNHYTKRMTEEELNEYRIKRSASLSKASIGIHIGGANGMAHKVVAILNDKKMFFDCVKDCREYFNEKYSLQYGTVKRLLKKQISYEPTLEKYELLKGLVLKYID